MRKFFISDSGAVTVDWVVLTAGLVGASSVVGMAMEPVIEASIEAIEDDLPGGGPNYGRHAAEELIACNFDARRFVVVGFWTKESKAGVAANIDRAMTYVAKDVSMHKQITASALHLHGIGFFTRLRLCFPP